MSVLIKGLDIDSHSVIKCYIVPYKDRAQLIIGNKYDEGKTYDVFEVPTPHGDLIDKEELNLSIEHYHGRFRFVNESHVVIESEE